MKSTLRCTRNTNWTNERGHVIPGATRGHPLASDVPKDAGSTPWRWPRSCHPRAWRNSDGGVSQPCKSRRGPGRCHPRTRLPLCGLWRSASGTLLASPSRRNPGDGARADGRGLCRHGPAMALPLEVVRRACVRDAQVAPDSPTPPLCGD